MSDREHLYTCEHCGAPIYAGGKAQFDSEGIALCADHAATLSDNIASWQADLESDEPYWPEIFDTMEEVKTMIEGLRDQLARDGDGPVLVEV